MSDVADRQLLGCETGKRLFVHLPYRPATSTLKIDI